MDAARKIEIVKAVCSFVTKEKWLPLDPTKYPDDGRAICANYQAIADAMRNACEPHNATEFRWVRDWLEAELQAFSRSHPMGFTENTMGLAHREWCDVADFLDHCFAHIQGRSRMEPMEPAWSEAIRSGGLTAYGPYLDWLEENGTPADELTAAKAVTGLLRFVWETTGERQARGAETAWVEFRGDIAQFTPEPFSENAIDHMEDVEIPEDLRIARVVLNPLARGAASARKYRPVGELLAREGFELKASGQVDFCLMVHSTMTDGE